MMERVSLPTDGKLDHGIFVAYFDRKPCDMFLQIGGSERVIFWALRNLDHSLTIQKTP